MSLKTNHEFYKIETLRQIKSPFFKLKIVWNWQLKVNLLSKKSQIQLIQMKNLKQTFKHPNLIFHHWEFSWLCYKNEIKTICSKRRNFCRTASLVKKQNEKKNKNKRLFNMKSWFCVIFEKFFCKTEVFFFNKSQISVVELWLKIASFKDCSF